MSLIKWLKHRLGLDHSSSLQLFGVCPCENCCVQRESQFGSREPRPGWITKAFARSFSAYYPEE